MEQIKVREAGGFVKKVLVVKKRLWL